MAITCAPERPQVKPVKRARGPQLLTLFFTIFQPIALGLPYCLMEQPMKAATRKHPYIPPQTSIRPQPIPGSAATSTPPPGQQIDNLFIDALAKACCCRKHKSTGRPRPRLTQVTSPHHSTRRKQFTRDGGQKRRLHQASMIQRPRITRSTLSRDECLNMLDYYSEYYSTLATWHEPSPTPPIDPPSLKSEHPGMPSLDQGLMSGFSMADRPGATGDTELNDKSKVENLLSTLEDPECTQKEAWAAYSILPSPGVAYLEEPSRHRLLQCLSTVERKNRDSMFRYLSVVDDVHSINQPLTEAEWNSAIAFSAHSFERITAEGVQSALIKWKEMEQQARVKAGNVTFNILFDMATKAGKFVLAEMILKEMESRNLTISRFARVGLMYYHGLKGDGDAVRQAYRDFVEAGEIVDTVVMNCVIASLIRAGELSAAEQVYERMKLVLREHTGRRIPNLHWKEPRDLGRVLDRAARKCRDKPEALQKLQEEQFLAPSQRTYAIFVEHHATRTGELRRIASLLAEMQALGVPMDGRIFVKVFKGFAYHGGIRYTAWTRARLLRVWESLLSVLDQRLDSVKLNRWLAVWIVRAFQKCCDNEQTLQIWEELRKRWKDDYSELVKTHDMLKDVLKDAVMKVAKAPTKMYIH